MAAPSLMSYALRSSVKYLRERTLNTMTRIRTLSLSLLLAVVAAGFATAAPNKPKSVIHVITIQWKADATPEQIQLSGY
jgi:hypothetical protein